MAQALLAVDTSAQGAPLEWLQGAARARDGLRIHRNTVLGGCWHALRLSYPSLERWLGEAAFEALAADFARAHPPREPALGAYGGPFAAFVAARLPGDAARIAADLAAFDWLIERLSQQAPTSVAEGPSIALHAGLALQLHASLRLHAAQWPVDALRERLLEVPAGREPAVIAGPLPDLAPRPCQWALWRTHSGVHLQSLSPAAASLLRSLLDGQPLDDAFDPSTDLAALLERELLRAGMAALSIRPYIAPSMYAAGESA